MSNPPPQSRQADYWDRWNLAARSGKLPPGSARQGAEVERHVAASARHDLRILDVGCGAGWLCERLCNYGRVTGTDMTRASLDAARARVPGATFVCGDFFELEFPARSFDVVTSLEVLSHVADQPAFVRRLASLLKPNGLLILSTQNRPVYERWSVVAEPDPSQVRQWVDHQALRSLLAPHFDQVEIRSVFPVGDKGLLRIVNATKLNRALEHLVPASTIEGWKEAAMLGATLIATARQPASAPSAH